MKICLQQMKMNWQGSAAFDNQSKAASSLPQVLLCSSFFRWATALLGLYHSIWLS
jgi:hypothetical protein